MQSAPIYVASSTLPLIGASCWLLLSGSMVPPHRLPSLPLVGSTATLIVPAFGAAEIGSEIEDVWLNPATSQVSTEGLQGFVQAKVIEPPAAQDGPHVTAVMAPSDREGEAVPMDEIPLPPNRPRVPKVAPMMKRMRHAVTMLSKKDGPSHSVAVLSPQNEARRAIDSVTFFRENPPRLLDILSIPN